MSATITRTAFRTSRLLDFCSRKELVAQTGHSPEAWPLVVLKELVDNALDACEDAGTAPSITVTVDDEGIRVSDNGPGIPAETVADVIPALADVLGVALDDLYSSDDDEEADQPMDAMDMELLRALKKWRTANQGAIA